MKTLLLMRHAKSSWKEPLPDHERPLNKRGRKTAKAMGKYLAKHSLLPELVVSSDAVRARETARRLAKAAGIPMEKIRLDPGLYEADTDRILDRIHSLDPRADSAMIVAHNPGISDTALFLSGAAELEWMPTAAVAIIDFDAENWQEIGKHRGKLRRYLRPKSLEE